MHARTYEYVVVGAGAAGAAAARELARRGRDVLVLERGRRPAEVGRYRDAVQFYDAAPVSHRPRTSEEGVILWRAITPGGSTVAACGNAVACLLPELAGLGVDLEEDVREMRAEMQVAPLDEGMLTEGSRALRDAGSALGLSFTPMPKALDQGRCTRCGNCTLGCRSDAKWTAVRVLSEAAALGAEVREGVRVDRVAVARGSVRGVVARANGSEEEIAAERVILAAGGMETPAILQRSGVERAGHSFFADLFVNVYGLTAHTGQVEEPLMSLVDDEFHESEGFLLSPFVNHQRRVRFAEGGRRGFSLPLGRTLGVLVKTKDEPIGRVFPDGRISKDVKPADRRRLQAGSALSLRLLAAAGARPDSMLVSRVQGAHPGGGAALGDVVDADLQTEVENLFVCDGSVLPTAPGAPPMLTLAALGRWHGRRLAG